MREICPILVKKRAACADYRAYQAMQTARAGRPAWTVSIILQPRHSMPRRAGSKPLAAWPAPVHSST